MLSEVDHISIVFRQFSSQMEIDWTSCFWWLIWLIQNDSNNLKMTETKVNGNSAESTQQELSNEYQHDMV